MFWGGSRSTKPCVFPCKVAAGDDDRYLVCVTGAAAVGLSFFFLPQCNGGLKLLWVCLCVRSFRVFRNLRLQIALEWLHDCCHLVFWCCSVRRQVQVCELMLRTLLSWLHDVAWAMFWGGSRSTKPCVFPCKVAAADDERFLVCATGAAAVGLSFFLPQCNGGLKLLWVCLCVRSYRNPQPLEVTVCSWGNASLSLCLSVCLSVCLSIYLSIYLQNQKQRNSARLPSCLNIRTSKTEQVSGTPSFFELDNIRNEAILRDFLIFRSARHQKRRILRDILQKWIVECRADRLVPMRFAIFPVHLSKVLRLPRKNGCQVIRSAAPVTQNHLSKPTDLILQNATPLRKSAPWPPNISHEHVFCTAPATKMHVCRSSSNVLCLPSFLEMLQNPHVLVTFDKVHNPLRLPRETTSEPPKVARTCGALYILTWKCASRHNGVHFFDISTSKSGRQWCVLHILTWKRASRNNGVHFFNISISKSGPNGVFRTFWLGNVLRATTACTFSTSELPKVVREWCALYILTWKCASRHNGVHFFDIWTSKSGLRMVCFVHFDLEMCFAPQRRALFQHLNFQKWSGAEVFCTFWLRNVLRATTACNFSSLIWPAGSAPAALASLLFHPSGATNHWKNTVFRDFPTFSRICIFFLLTLSLLLFSLLIFLFSLILSISAFHLSILSEAWLLNFLRLLLEPQLPWANGMEIPHCKVGLRQAVAAKVARVASLNQDMLDQLDQLDRLMGSVLCKLCSTK